MANVIQQSYPQNSFFNNISNSTRSAHCNEYLKTSNDFFKKTIPPQNGRGGGEFVVVSFTDNVDDKDVSQHISGNVQDNRTNDPSRPARRRLESIINYIFRCLFSCCTCRYPKPEQGGTDSDKNSLTSSSKDEDSKCKEDLNDTNLNEKLVTIDNGDEDSECEEDLNDTNLNEKLYHS